ncbi:DUF4175 family protein [Lacihabitans sp. CS3-21]|uniref:DUF4175 family protein n=1 Tax=Lacihabitans sp. CS3-21 TaxID=2487332 RepID=UPI0020CE792F|nr:DUF4175 family protein [Lacihabitans sp. CS3-21]MCP9745198.1 ATPase [Lacihabitans sp. CS3-21]
MKKNVEFSGLIEKISEFKSKYYKNLLLKGALIGLSLILFSYIVINFLEYFGRFSSSFRAVLLIGFIAVSAYTLFFYILKPLFYLLNFNKPISDETAAQQIGTFFPNIKDKLLNTLQLANGLSDTDNALLEASIAQKTKELKLVKFADAINLKENRKYLKYSLPPLLAILLISAIAPSFFKSTERIVYFKRNFAEPAPFQFEILNKNLQAVKNEDYQLNLRLLGNSLPEDVFLVYNDRKYKMNLKDSRNFDFVFSKVQEEAEFHFLAGGFTSNTFKLAMIARPSLLSFNVELKYPAYLNKTSEDFDNVGNLIVPEGTVVEWKFKTDETDSLKVIFEGNKPLNISKGFITDFNFQKRFAKSSNYEVILKNENATTNAEKISYYINVIPDKFPQISFEQIKDSSLYNYIGIGGSISDDYGLSDFKFMYRTKAGNTPFKAVDIPFNKTSLSQTFFYQVNINNLGLEKSDRLEYYLQVTDNDGVNGHKSTKSGTMTFGMPTSQQFDQEVEKQIEKTEDKFEDLLQKSKEFKKALENLESDLKKKKEMDFQDKKEFEELLKKKDEMMKELKDLQKQLQDLKEKQNRFEKQSPEMQQKMDMLQKMLDELMKNEDSKALEDLKKMMEEQLNDKSLDKMNDFKKDQRNIDKEIDRTMKLFKDLQLKQKVEETVKELEKLAQKQEDLADKTEKENKDSPKNDELKKEQEKLNNEFEEKKEKLNDIEKLSKELKKEVDTQKEEQKDVSEEQKKAQKEMENKDNKAASKAQKKASKSMKKMAAEMSENMQGAEMKQLDIDIDALRDILENLLKISHDQERVMKNFRSISVSDPRFVNLSQEQLKISDDAKVVEDSLYSLAKRVMQIESFITKEVTDMKNSIDESVKFIKERKTPQAASKQQFSMTSMNNLALMLGDTFKQMQQMMAMAMPGSGKGGKQGNTPSEGMGEKQQELNKKIQGMGQSGMGGKQLSEELAKIANEQSKIRKQLKDLQEQMNGTEQGKKLGNNLDELQKKMDESENDLVNKRITPALLKRQKEIEIRLLEAEKAIKEQELDTKRKSNTGVTFNRVSPPDLEKFKKEKEKQVELLRTTPPNFTPFYKKQTDSYFKRIN